MLMSILAGCAAEITQDELDWRRGIDLENWDLCYRIMKEYRIVMIYKNYSGHIMPDDWRSGLTPFVVKELLAQNQCRQILNEHWAEY